MCFPLNNILSFKPCSVNKVPVVFTKDILIIFVFFFDDHLVISENHMETSTENARELALLENIERDPDITQVSLASHLGVAVGTVNWHLKRLIAKGYVKIKRAERKKLRYIITPEGIALRTRLTMDYIEQQFLLYRNTRKRVIEHLNTIQQAGYNHVRLVGDGEIAEICKLSCLERGISLVATDSAPVLEVTGLNVALHMGEPHED
jgi:DNA-binding MarR family transcriptional regulator